MASSEISDDVFDDLPAPSCAHSRVRRVPLNHDDGTVSDRWLCDDCLREFAPLSERKAVVFCDVCPHNLALHNADGSCGCGMDCAAIRARR